jgi:hypothetical protein
VLCTANNATGSNYFRKKISIEIRKPQNQRMMRLSGNAWAQENLIRPLNRKKTVVTLNPV